jgi:CMP-N-acetylneuraminic acid synthetase
MELNKILKIQNKNIYAFETTQERSVDVDTKLDFKIAEALIKGVIK